MPNSGDWFYIDIPSMSSSTSFPHSTAQQMYDEWKQECERQDHIHEQILQEQAELIEDKKKYPLFFWKENI